MDHTVKLIDLPLTNGDYIDVLFAIKHNTVRIKIGSVVMTPEMKKLVDAIMRHLDVSFGDTVIVTVFE